MDKGHLLGIRDAIDKYSGEPEDLSNELKELQASKNVKISGDIERDMNFDASGNWTFSYSQYSPLNIDATAWVMNSDGVFDVYLDTNKPQHEEWHALLQNQQFSTTIRTCWFEATSLNIVVHSNKPNASAKFHLHYCV